MRLRAGRTVPRRRDYGSGFELFLTKPKVSSIDCLRMVLSELTSLSPGLAFLHHTSVAGETRQIGQSSEIIK